MISSFVETGVTIKKRVHFIEEEKKERSGEYYLKNKIQKVMTEWILWNLKYQSQTVITEGCWQILDRWYNTGVGVKWIINCHLFITYCLGSPYLNTLPSNLHRFLDDFTWNSQTLSSIFHCIFFSILLCLNTGVDQKKVKERQVITSDLLVTKE